MCTPYRTVLHFIFEAAPVGAAFDAFQAVGNVLRTAQRDVLIADPYINATILTDFAPLAPEGVSMRLLSDVFYTKPDAVMPAAGRWIAQYGADRPLQVRQTAPRLMHNRIIVVDGVRAFATVVRAEGDAAQLEIDAYGQLWDGANRLVE